MRNTYRLKNAGIIKEKEIKAEHIKYLVSYNISSIGSIGAEFAQNKLKRKRDSRQQSSQHIVIKTVHSSITYSKFIFTKPSFSSRGPVSPSPANFNQLVTMAWLSSSNLRKYRTQPCSS